MKRTIKVKITTEHFKNATNYSDNENCPLAMAVKDVFPEVTEIDVICGWVIVGRKTYSVTKDWNSGQKIYGGKFKGMDIDEMIKLAKGGTRIPIKYLTLNLVD
jgi:hypothetical protein